VTLFDCFLTDFEITESTLVWHTSKRILSSSAQPEKGSGLLLKQRINPNERIRIKVHVTMYLCQVYTVLIC